MTKKLTRDQAIKLVGLAAVDAVESINCEHRSTQDNGLQWWSATVALEGNEEYETLTAYYSVDSDTVQGAEDLSDIDWVIDYYEAN